MLKLYLQTDLYLKGYILELPGTVSKDLNSDCSRRRGRVHPVVIHRCCFWRKVINRCEANVWDPIFVTRRRKVQSTVWGVWSTNHGQLMLGVLFAGGTKHSRGETSTRNEGNAMSGEIEVWHQSSSFILSYNVLLFRFPRFLYCGPVRCFWGCLLIVDGCKARTRSCFSSSCTIRLHEPPVCLLLGKCSVP